MSEGYAALYISIVRGVSPDKAFRLLSGQKAENKHWTKQEMQEIESLRENGHTWSDIGEMFDVNGCTVNKRFNEYKQKKGKWKC